MRKPVLVAACLLGYSVASADPVAGAADSGDTVVETGKIIVTVEAFDGRGTIRAMLYNPTSRYPTRPMRTEIRRVRQLRARFEFDNLPLGDYGVIAFQQMTNNTRPFDFHAITPYRPVAFSNDARMEAAARGAPPFDDIKFSLAEPELEITLVLFQ